MATIKETFLDAINKGFTAAATIIEPKDKAIAYAELAKAIALTGAIKSNVENTEAATEKESLKPEAGKSKKGSTKKDEPKEENKKADPKVEDTTPAEEPVQEEAQEETTVSGDTEWTEENKAKFAEQIELLEGCIDYYGEEDMVKAVEEFSEGNFHSLEDITPANIDAFLAFVKSMTETEE